MSEPPAAGVRRRPLVAWAGWGLALLLLAYTAVLFYGMGPRFKDASWYEPTGWLARAIGDTDLYPLADDVRIALALFGGAAAALGAAVFFTTRAALPRLLAVWSLVSAACILFYGVEAPFVWRFFAWRWSASMLLFSAVVATALCAPLLAAGWLRLPVLLRAAVYLPIALLVLAYERNVTGTDQALRFAISPWPVVQIFGIELLGTLLGMLLLGVGGGLHLLRRAGGGIAPGAAATGVAAGLPTLALFIGSEQNLLPARIGGRVLLAVALAAALILALAPRIGAATDPERLRRRARHWTAAGLLVLAPILLGQLWARLDYTVTRESRARAVIDALARHYESEGLYPDRLTELVERGHLESVPEPSIGFSPFGQRAFVYQNFGTSYLLEFSAPRWIQCAYNPPYPDELEEEYEEDEAYEDGEPLGSGAWSCPSKPPELW